MKKSYLSIILSAILSIGICLSSYANHVEVKNLSADEALKKLKEGNKHFYTMHLKHPDQTIKRRLEGLNGQHPFVIILSCSDSRVSPEIIFDQGLGDIFEIRNAGNVLDDHVIGSIEYAVAHLGVNLVLVMGHQDCGAVKATIEHERESKHIESLIKSIKPSVQESKSQKGDLLENSIKNNAKFVVKKLKKSKPIINKYVESGTLKIVPAYYNIDSGIVEFIE